MPIPIIVKLGYILKLLPDFVPILFVSFRSESITDRSRTCLTCRGHYTPVKTSLVSSTLLKQCGNWLSLKYNILNGSFLADQQMGLFS